MAWRTQKPLTRVLIARHGQTVSNREGRFCGHSETPLTPLGVAQGRALAARLATTPIAAAYTSDFARAIETAALVLEGRGLTPKVDPDLRELHYGEWELRRERDVARSHREEFRRMVAEDPAWQPPGGESLAMVRSRTFAALQRILAGHQHETVLVVTHGTAISCMLAELLGMDPGHTFRFEVANCGLSEVTARGERAVLTLLNGTAHLSGVGEASR